MNLVQNSFVCSLKWVEVRCGGEFAKGVKEMFSLLEWRPKQTFRITLEKPQNECANYK